jgi:hypothetical protein
MKPKERGTLVAVLALWSTMACSDATDAGKATGGNSNGAEAGGTTSNGGAGGATSSVGGAGGGAQLIAQAALTVSVAPPAVAVAQMSCPANSTRELGSPAPTPSDPGQSVISGVNGSLITCSVTGKGPYSFSGSIQFATASGAPIEINFANGSVGADFTGTADINVFTPELSTNYNSTAPCAITVENQQVKGGAMWAAFNCPQIASPPSGLCQLTGTVVLENCDGS